MNRLKSVILLAILVQIGSGAGMKMLLRPELSRAVAEFLLPAHDEPTSIFRKTFVLLHGETAVHAALQNAQRRVLAMIAGFLLLAAMSGVALVYHWLTRRAHERQAGILYWRSVVFSCFLGAQASIIGLLLLLGLGTDAVSLGATALTYSYFARKFWDIKDDDAQILLFWGGTVMVLIAMSSFLLEFASVKIFALAVAWRLHMLYDGRPDTVEGKGAQTAPPPMTESHTENTPKTA